MEYTDKNGETLIKGSTVDVAEPNETDDHESPFRGTILDFWSRGPLKVAVIRAPDGDNYEVETNRLTRVG